ncbi:MAG: GNAT family N-acetyltransferase [Eubacteriales bacterium]|nr:GNAT family N-acetyltransferase [Eubacteriales bacterium]
MKGTITLTTARLTLRMETPGDADILYKELGCDPEITRFTGWNPYFTPEAARAKICEDMENDGKDCYSWIIEIGGTPVGSIGAYGYDPDTSSIEIGCSIFHSEWGQGYASEAVSAVAHYLLEGEGLNRVHAWCHAGNFGSARVLEKSGFHLEGILRQAMRGGDGELADQKLYGLLASDLSSKTN